MYVVLLLESAGAIFYCIAGVHSNQDLIMCKNRGVYGFLGTSRVLITYMCPPV